MFSVGDSHIHITADLKAGLPLIVLVVEAFPQLKKEIESLEHEIYLPEKTELMQKRTKDKWMPPREDLLRLVFLSTLKEGKYPFTEEGFKIFKASKSADKVTHQWLGWRAIVTFGALAGAAAFTNVFNYVTILQRSNQTEGHLSNVTTVANDAATKLFQIATITALNGLLGFATDMAGLWFTGRNPDASSIAANKQQDMMASLKKEYKNLAMVLEKLYFTYPDLATLMAKEMDIELIKRLIQKETCKANAPDLIGLGELVCSVDYIKSGRQLLPSEIDHQNRLLELEKSFGLS